MSTLRVNSIQNASGTDAISIGSDGSLSYPNIGRRNLIVNGAMQVAQRGTSSTSTGYITCDRYAFASVGIGSYTVTQSTDAPSGFANSFKVDCTTADASPTTSDRLWVYQRLEGQDLQQLSKGTSDAKQVTLSFWVKSNKTGVGQVNLYDNDNTRIVNGSYTILSAGTWEYKTITFAADTTGAFDNNNEYSLALEWWLDSGSDYTGGATSTSWSAYSSSTVKNADGTLAIADSTSNYWQITGVQLEVGSVATPFEHRSYGEELALCQRYYQTIWKTVGMWVSSNQIRCTHDLVCQMRTTPSISISSTTPYAEKFAVAGTTGSGSTVLNSYGTFDFFDAVIGGFSTGFSALDPGLAAGDGSKSIPLFLLDAEL
jgi:hypothetical protein